MIIENGFTSDLRIFLTRDEYIINAWRIGYNSQNRVITNNTSFVKADTSTLTNNIESNSIVSQQWFYTTFPDQKKMANHTFTISTYSDNTLSKKIGEITFSANLLDYGEQGIILEGIITDGGFEPSYPLSNPSRPLSKPSRPFLDYEDQYIITEGRGLEQYINIQMFSVQSAYGIYDKIHKVILENILFLGSSIFNFVKKY